MENSPTVNNLRPIHPFPARMAPSIAMSELSRSRGKRLRVLDPMVGSGTTVVLAKMLGHRAYGFDIDPLAVLLAESWATSKAEASLLTGAREVLGSARDRFRELRFRDGYPVGADDETKKFVRYWFDDHARRQLRALAEVIAEGPEDIRNLLWASFSRTIITKTRGVSLAMDLSHSRPHRVYDKAPVRPFDTFLHAVDQVAKSAPFVEKVRRPKSQYPEVRIATGDARKLACRSASFDLVITSPPYLNAIDYIRCSKFALVWMGHAIPDLRETRSTSIGSEVALPDDESAGVLAILSRVPARRQLPPRWSRILDRYVLDMRKMIAETARVLKDGGRAVFVVGDSRVRGVFVSNSRIVEMLAEQEGLHLEDRERRKLMTSRRYLPPPTSEGSDEQLRTRMGYEVILRFTRHRV